MGSSYYRDGLFDTKHGPGQTSFAAAVVSGVVGNLLMANIALDPVIPPFDPELSIQKMMSLDAMKYEFTTNKIIAFLNKPVSSIPLVEGSNDERCVSLHCWKYHESRGWYSYTAMGKRWDLWNMHFTRFPVGRPRLP